MDTNVSAEELVATLQRRAATDRLIAEILTSALWETAYRQAAAVVQSDEEAATGERGDGESVE